MSKDRTSTGLNRREFIRSTAAVGAGLIFSPMVLGETTSGAVAKSDDINVESGFRSKVKHHSPDRMVPGFTAFITGRLRRP